MQNLKIDKNKIRKSCKKHDVMLLILHGSYAKGLTTPKSDIDVGILIKGKLTGEKHSELIKDFGGIFGDKFDPVFLNNAEPMITYHVAISGTLLYEAKRGTFAAFKVQAIARYQDTKKFRDMEKAYIKRAAGRA